MKAISLHQPYCSLIAQGLKKFETRSWATNYRGLLLICSAKLKELDQKSRHMWLKDQHNLNIESFEWLRFGCAIALTELTDCLLMDETLIQSQPQLEIDCGGWTVGRYAWKLENIRVVVPIVEIKGKQGLFNFEVELSENDLEVVSDFQPHAKFCTRSKSQNKKPVLPDNAPIAVVFFAGGGGIEASMIEAGILPIIAIEFDPDKPKLSGAIADCHDRNFAQYGCKLIRKTVQEIAAAGFPGFPRTPDYLHASPVCSNFSNAKTNGLESDDDKAAARSVASAITTLKPKNFTLENVPRYKDSESFQIILAALGLEGYQVAWDIINMADYGLPQARRRLILRASIGIPIGLPQKSAQIGWYEAIAYLIPSMANSRLVPGQRRAVATFLEGNEPTPLLINRVGGRNEYRYKPGHLPCSTLMRSHFTDEKGANRNKFADIWLPDGTVKSLSIEGAAILQGFPSWYQFPNSAATAGSIIGYSVPPSFALQLFQSMSEQNLMLTLQLMQLGISEADAKRLIEAQSHIQLTSD
jgi:DNA (cytosine-5)-methyltransferase 1